MGKKIEVTLKRGEGYSLVIDGANGGTKSFDKDVPVVVSEEMANRLKQKANVEFTYGKGQKELRNIFDYREVEDVVAKVKYPEQAEVPSLPDANQEAPGVPGKTVEQVAEENYAHETPVKTADGTMSAEEANALPDSVQKAVASRRAAGHTPPRPPLKEEK